MTMLRRTAIAVIGTAILVGWQSTGHAQDARQALAQASVIEEIKARGTLRVGLDTFVPWAMRAKSGELIGFEVDVARKIAEDMGVQLELVPTAWDGIIPALVAGKFDAIISGMSVTAQRNLTVNFTVPYASSGIGLLANKQLAGTFKSVEDFNKPEIKLAVRRGATPVQVAQRLMPNAELLQFDDENQAVQEVLNGNAHALLASEPLPAFTALKNPDKVVLPFDDDLQDSAEAIALRKGDPDALNWFNNWILTNSLNGWLDDRHDYWFASLDWQDQVEGQ